jgi:hypothetical protein
MISHPRPKQLASILPPPSGHRECYMQFTVPMPGAEADIFVQSQDEIHVMIVFLILPWAIPMMVYTKNQLYKTKATRNYVSKHKLLPIPIRLQSRITITLVLNHDGNRQ